MSRRSLDSTIIIIDGVSFAAKGVLVQGAIRVCYGTRRLPGGKFGIHILTYRNGSLETEDMNTTPWPDAGAAFVMARRWAEATLEREAR